MEQNFLPENWLQESRLLQWEPTHESGIGRYYKIPGSGTDTKGYFAFIRAVYNQRFYEEDISEYGEHDWRFKARCDSSAPKSMPMPTALHESDDETGLCTFCGSDKPVFGTTNSHNASLSNSLVLRMPFQGYKGFICYLELRDPEIEEHEVYENPNVARTLQELFKLMFEWDWVYENIDNTDVCAVLCHEMLIELQMPENIKQWVLDNVPDMHVARFFRGEIDARSRPDVTTIPNMSEEFERWCWYNVVKGPVTWTYGGK